MRRHSRPVTALIVIFTLGACLMASAQGVRFVTPEDGDTVRGTVRLEATKPNPDEGWISYRIETGGEGDFVAAVTPPYRYEWNTLARDDEGNDVYEDGQYTLTAVALSPSGRKMGDASITVTLKNSVSASDAPRRVPLQLWYQRNQQVHYRAEGQWKIEPQKDEENPEDVYQLATDANGAMVANWKNRVMSPSVAAGHALLHVVVDRAGEQRGTQSVAVLDGAGHSHTYRALRGGEMRLKHSDEQAFPYVEMTIPLPGREVRPGDTWNGEILVRAIPHSSVKPSEVQARHRAEGFEWIEGYQTLRIRSTFSVDEEKLSYALQPTQQTMGAEFGGGEMMGEPGMMEPGMMEPMGAMGMPPGGAMAPGGMMEGGGMGFGDEMGMMEGVGMGAAAAQIETSYTGERTTWWSWELNRPLRIEDRIVHTLEVPRQSAMGGEMGMMPGEGGMGYEEMMPGGMMQPPGEMPPGAMPGEMPGAGMFEGGPMMEGGPMGMMEGGPMGAMPGMGMGGEMGMGQMQQTEPMKVTIEVGLTIREVDL